MKAMCRWLSLAITVLVGFSVWADRAINENQTLSYDLNAEGKITVATGATIDLAGHKLVASDLAGGGTITDTVGGGELHLVVSEEAPVNNTQVSLTGNLRLVKEGPGTFTASKSDQAYTGGTDVTAGTFVLGTNQHPMGPGNGTCNVTVRKGATIDVNNCFGVGSAVYNYVDLAGTVLIAVANSNTMWTFDGRNYWINGLSLSGDATIRGGYFCLGGDSASLAMTLNGHTLTLDIGEEQLIYLANVTADETGGRITMSGGPLHTANANLQTVGVDFIGSAYQFFNTSLKVRDFSYARNFWMSHGNASTVDVCGTYTAGEYRPPLVLQDGATIDLSKQTAVWSADGTKATTGSNNRKFYDSGLVSFAKGANITVDLGERTLSPELKLVTWSDAPLVARFVGRGTNFDGFWLQAREDGLYAVSAAIPAWAVWDLANNRWQYFKDNGEPYAGEWTAGITDKIDVHFSSIEEFNAIKSQGVTPARFVLTRLELPQGTALYDFTGGFNFTIPPNAVIDIKCNKVKLPAALIGGKVPFVVAASPDRTAESPDILKDACFWLDALDKNTMEIDENGKVKSWTSKDANKVVATATSEPTYTVTAGLLPTVDFGAIGSNIDMTYRSFTNLRTVFWVMQIDRGVGAFFLGDSREIKFHRGANGEYGAGHARYASMWNGLSAVAINDDIPPNDRFCVYSATMSENVCSDRLTTDRDIVDAGVTRSGGRKLSELICFNTVLDEEDRRTVVKYLQTKWFPAGGELIVDVPEGQTVVNDNVAIMGNVQLVKTGSGTLVVNKESQSYIGGTTISNGMIKLGSSTSLGLSGSEITVERDGILEVNGMHELHGLKFVLAGGTLQNTAADIDFHYAQIANVRLTADSTFRPTCSFGLINGGYAPATLDLAGYTLTVPIGVGKTFWFYNVTVTEGTIDLTSGGTLHADMTSVRAGDTTFRVNCALKIDVPFTVGSYEGLYPSDYNYGNGIIAVNKAFKPCTPYYHGVTLADGATLDLSAFPGVFTGTSAFGEGAKTVTYPAGDASGGNAKLFVELSGRRLTEKKIIGWDSGSKPEFLDFEETEKTKKGGCWVTTEEEGVYVKSGLVLLIR